MSSSIQKTFVWSRNIRLFHWLNVISVLLLIVIGLALYFDDALGLSTEGKILLKTIHVLIGYVFAINLLFRILLGFIGSGLESWSKTLPFTKAYQQELAILKHDNNTTFSGHSPKGKLMVAILLLLLTIQMISGLILASTDIYYPPFGHYFAKSIAIDKTKLETIKPYSKENVDKEAFQSMRAIRKPFITAHKYSFYLLLLLIPLHILAVIFTERKEKSSLVSAMIHGYKYLPKKDNISK